MTRLHLIRHGPTHARGLVGWSDLPADLSDTAALARLAAALPPDAVVISSDLIRAAATADAIQGARHRLPHEPDLREIAFGAWEMRPFRDIEAEDPARARAFWERPGDVAPPGGESWHAMRARTDAAIDRLVAAHSGRDVIVVAHFGVILGQYQRAEGLTAEAALAQRIDNLSLTRLTRLADGWHTECVNCRP